jgi:energy-coupling factor transport system substrate-specific component
MSWILASMLVLGAALAAGFAWYERTHPSSRVLALVATLAALAALGRVAFAPLPNVKPTTDIVLLSGYVLGGAPGFVVGAVAALASNLFFGQGPWTPWQMVAWGGVGAGGALLARVTGRRLGRVPLAAVCGFAGLAYGAVMNLHLWVTYSGDHTLAKLGAVFATSFPFDVAHAVGNVVFCLAFGPALVRALRRYRSRMEVTWVPARGAGAAAGGGGGAATVAGVLVGAVVAAGSIAAAAPPSAQAQSADAAAASRSLSYLLRAQNADGGWGAAPGQRSSGLYTGWAALGVAAAGRDPHVTAYLRAHPEQLSDAGAVSRTILVMSAVGESPKALVRRLLAKRRGDGAYGGRVNTTAFAILALRSAGRSTRSRPVRTAGRWLARQANRDGGFNFAGRGGPSGIDDTGAAVQGLVAAGRKGTKTVRRAVRFMLRRQNADGGFPLTPGGASNAQSTAWAVQAFLAAGREPAKVHTGGSRDPMAYLRSLTAADGVVRYSRTSAQTPVWVTAQAVMALARKPLPFPPLAHHAATASAAPATPRPAATPRATPAATKAPKAEATATATPAAAAAMITPARARTAGFLAGTAAALL